MVISDLTDRVSCCVAVQLDRQYHISVGEKAGIIHVGKAVSGPYAGRALKQIYALNDYWFDWKAYNPDTVIYR